MIRDKLVNLLNCVSCMLKTRSRANKPCVLTCSSANVICVSRAHVPTCLECLLPHRSTCLACLSTRVSTWLARSPDHVPTCLESLALYGFAWSHDHLLTCLASSVGSFDATFSVSLPLLLKLWTLLVRFKSLTNVSPQ